MEQETELITVPEICSTDDYKEFKKHPFNRDLVQSNVAKLIKENEIKFNMQFFPITVDSEMRVIDGQHRLEACKQKAWPVFYVCDN